MIFTYTRQTNRYYDHVRDKEYYDEYDFDYEPTNEEILDALADILVGQSNVETNKEELKVVTKKIKQIIKDSDIQDILEERYKDELKDWFEDKAMASEGD